MADYKLDGVSSPSDNRDDSAPETAPSADTTDVEQTNPPGSEALDYVNDLIHRMNGSGPNSPPLDLPQDETVTPAGGSEPDKPTPSVTPGTDNAETEEPLANDMDVSGLSTAWLAQRISAAETTTAGEKSGKNVAATGPAEPERPAEIPKPRRRATRPGDVPTDLERLREAANLTAFGALHTFDCRSLVRRAYAYFAFAVISVFLSTALIELTVSVNSMAYFLSVVTMLLAVWSTWKYFSSTFVLCAKLKARQPSERANRFVNAAPSRPPLPQ